MNRSRLIIGILAVVHLILTVIAFSFLFCQGDRPGSWMIMPLTMLLVCQGSLIGMWAAFCGKSTPLRVMLTFIVIAICLQVADICFDLHELWEGIQALNIQIMNISVVFLILRLAGLEIKNTPIEPWKPKPFQFTIWQIMAWTTTLAVVMSAVHYFPRRSFYSQYGMQSCLLLFISLGGVALASFWLIFGRKLILCRMLVALAAIGTGTWCLACVVDSNWMHFATLLGFEAIWTIASLLVIRWAGYRMTWLWRLRRFKESS